MNNKKRNIIFSIIGFLILISGVIVGTILVQQNQNIREKAAPATSVYISPSTQNKNPGDNFILSVKMDTGENQVTGVDIRLNYNPDLVEITSIEKGTNIGALDSQIINTFDNVTGKISYAVYTANKENAITGSSIEILTINGNVKDTASGNATFSFDPTTVISGISEGQNVIINSSSGSIIISSNESTTIPTATTTNTANATPTAVTTTTSTVTSGSTTTATSTATSTATATATSTASGQPNSCNGTCGSNSNCRSRNIMANNSWYWIWNIYYSRCTSIGTLVFSQRLLLSLIQNYFIFFYFVKSY